jgi:hypothetical protein
VVFLPASNPPIAVVAVLAIPPKLVDLIPKPLNPYPNLLFIKLSVSLEFI